MTLQRDQLFILHWGVSRPMTSPQTAFQPHTGQNVPYYFLLPPKHIIIFSVFFQQRCVTCVSRTCGPHHPPLKWPTSDSRAGLYLDRAVKRPLLVGMILSHSRCLFKALHPEPRGPRRARGTEAEMLRHVFTSYSAAVADARAPHRCTSQPAPSLSSAANILPKPLNPSATPTLLGSSPLFQKYLYATRVPHARHFSRLVWTHVK